MMQDAEQGWAAGRIDGWILFATLGKFPRISPALIGPGWVASSLLEAPVTAVHRDRFVGAEGAVPVVSHAAIAVPRCRWRQVIDGAARIRSVRYVLNERKTGGVRWDREQRHAVAVETGIVSPRGIPVEIEIVVEIPTVGIVGVDIGIANQGIILRNRGLIFERHCEIDGRYSGGSGKGLGESKHAVRSRARDLERKRAGTSRLRNYRRQPVARIAAIGVIVISIQGVKVTDGIAFIVGAFADVLDTRRSLKFGDVAVYGRAELKIGQVGA